MSEGHLLLVDASGFAYRAFATSSPIHRESDGQPIGATLRFMEMLWRMQGAAEADKPTHGAAVFDVAGPTFRHKIYPAYKSNRDPARGLILGDQIPFMRHAADTLGLHPIEASGFEADDVIATLAAQAKRVGMRVTIVSSDKDFGQLVEDGKVEIVDPLQKRRVLAADVQKKFGVPPALVAHVQALAGDAVDGYPGIPGCGLALAAGLVRAYGKVPDVLKNAHKAPTPKLRRALKLHGDKAKTFLKLATLRRDVPLEAVTLDSLLLRPVMKSHLMAILHALEADRYAGMVFGIEEKNRCLVAPMGQEQWDWWKEEMKRPGQTLPDLPQAGFYKRRLVKGGPEVPARIWRDRQENGQDLLQCEVDGKTSDPFSEWPRLAMAPITMEIFGYMAADAAHARAYRPGDPKAKPSQPVNILNRPPSSNPRKRASP